MSIKRNISKELMRWKLKSNRKPLIIRGARQVGKTTVVKMFSTEYDYFIPLNLEKKLDQDYFTQNNDIKAIVDQLFFEFKIPRNSSEVLIFIDEIQEVPSAFGWLRYFYEEFPNIHVIAAGSLLEVVLDSNFNIPVGRVEYMKLHPFSFEEFLIALNEEQVIKAYNIIPHPAYAHKKTLELFHTYTLIGGMPEVVTNYAKNRDLIVLEDVFNSLLIGYIEDVEKYGKRNTLKQVIRKCIQVAFQYSGQQLSFSNFGNTNYKSREVGEALRIIEKALILQLIYPSTGYGLPILPNLKKTPRIFVFDTGLMNFFAGLQIDLFKGNDILDTFKGKVAEHIVGQELMSSNFSPLSKLNFWVRDKKNADAEIDFIINHKGNVIPIEVKAGSKGTLKSLHYYMENSKSSPIAVRLYAGQILYQTVEIKNNKPYQLLNLPYFLAGKIHDYVDHYLTHP